MARRDDFVRVRMVPAHMGHATQVKFKSEEREAIATVALELGMDMSTFIRELAVAAGLEHQAEAAQAVSGALFKKEVIERGAADAHMNPGEWMRVVALSAIGFSSLATQLAHAEKALKAGIPSDTGEG